VVQVGPLSVELKGRSQESRCKGGQLTVETAGASGICGTIHGPEKGRRNEAFVKSCTKEAVMDEWKEQHLI